MTIYISFHNQKYEKLESHNSVKTPTFKGLLRLKSKIWGIN